MRPAFALALLLTACVDAGPRGPVEITEVDFTTIAGFHARDATVLGVPMGASREQAERIIEAHPDFVVHPDGANPGRFYVDFAQPASREEESAFYFIWEPGHKGMNRVTVFRPAAALLRGEAKALLTTAALDDAAAPAHKFLDELGERHVSLDIPAIRLRHTSHWFPRRGIEVTEQVDEAYGTRQVVFALIVRDERER